MKVKRSVYRLKWVRERWVLCDSKGITINMWATKNHALGNARRYVRQLPPSQLIVHKKNGKFEYEHTYGADPERSKG
jgi:hypothetical protein